MRRPTCHDCDYCLDGMMPAGSHPDLGPVFIRCPFCLFTDALRPCRECGDCALFPADYTCLHCLLGVLADIGLTAAVCCGCAGITYITTLPDTDTDTDTDTDSGGLR